jgi:hypothetical protein
MHVDRGLLPGALVSLVQHESFEAELLSGFPHRVVLVLGQQLQLWSAPWSGC